MPKDDLSGKKLDHVSLSGANLADSDLSKSSLRRSHLEGASLRNANLAESDLQGAHLDHADLTGAVLRNADLTEADLRGADLGRAATTEGAKLAGAKGVPPERAEQAADDQVMSVGWAEDADEWGALDPLRLAPVMQRLLAALADPAWTTELPQTHVLTPLQEACEADGSPWRLEETHAGDEAFIVRVRWDRADATMRRLRVDVFGLIGAIAEAVTFVEQVRTEEAMEFRLTTGMLAGDGPSTRHGHLILLHVGGPAVERLLARG